MNVRNKFFKHLIYIILIIGVIIMTLPTIYMISTSLKPNGALYEYPPRLFPSKATIENYIYVIKEVDFYKNFINSVIVSVSTIAIVALVSSSLAYCISRLNFPGRKFIYVMILSTMIVPGMTLIIPQFELAVFFNMTNKLSGLVPIYVSWVVPFSTFMIKGFIDDVPKEFDEAVFIDGGNILTIYRHIMLPLASPAIATVSIFNFLTVWEEYPWALTVLNDKDVRTLPIAISGFFGQHNFTQWGYVFAMSVISLLPVILIFIFCQKFFVKGLSGGAVKG